ncbi:lipopolysaccharide assembly protein LapB [Kushneria indalinina]|uniref:Lipopolysaccharide assembly protein B n=1 Tax=Kushneria indalinina DSM 14324 TaxID=1122140 RepID=A0A3D9DYL4_9GAMM|nr:lipopolysaccharide assembly protein LapB [Kushneria indalinina]REC95439.1 lipopolysaccharide biosynthesis regulator YciM [Kushneria indalinina DSM 14324]
MPDPVLLLILVAAIGIGWWLGRMERKHYRYRHRALSGQHLSRDYFVGLNFLLNEQPDRAIETFVQALEVNGDTIDTHIALGNLFRMRGEADRAVRIHQNLLARPVLTTEQSEQVQLELARDFMRLGVLDRAERLLDALICQCENEETATAAKRLVVDLYEREKEWQAALEVALPQLIRQDEPLRRAAAHWHCELAEQAIEEGSPGPARRHLKQALSIDVACVRANWIHADIEHRAGSYRNEIRALRRIRDQDSDMVPITLAPIQRAFDLLDDEEGLIDFLHDQIEKAPYVSFVLLLAERLHARDGVESATRLVSEQLQGNPSLRGIDYLMDLYLKEVPAHELDHLRLLKRHTEQLMAQRARYRCKSCGFQGEQLYWHCPSCRQWGTIKPITGLEGE